MYKARPYTYMLICDQTGQKYIGSRSANKHCADEDIKYMSSSSTVVRMIQDGFTFKKLILAEWNTHHEVLEHEIFLHECFDVGKNKDFLNRARQTSISFTAYGYKGMSNSRRGIPNPEHSARLKGRSNPSVSLALKGRIRPDISAKLKGRPNPGVSAALIGRSLTPETRAKMSDAKKGKPPNNKGKKLSDETCRKMSESRMGQTSPTKGMKYVKVECPHCGLFGGGPQMTRYHFDNCKQRLLT